MAQLGMDVDAVEAAGRELQSKAQSIDAIVVQVNRSVASLESVWDGRDAQSFNASWPDIQKSIAAASQAVAGLGQSALNNASEQRQASGASGSGSTPFNSGGLSTLPGTVPMGPSMEEQFWNGSQGFLNTDIPGTPWSVDQIGGLIPHVSDGIDVLDIANSLHSGQVPWLSMLSVGAGELKSDPATYWAGAAVSTWTTVGKDLSDAIALGPPTNDLSYIASDPLGALDAAVQANVKAFPDLIGDLLP